MDAFAVTLRHARWYGTGTESGSTALAAEDATYDFDVSSGNVTCQYRVSIEETGSGSISGASTDDYRVQYRKNATGSYFDVPATSSGAGLQVATAGLTNTNDCTQRLTAGAGTFVTPNTGQSTDGEVENFALTANNYTEFCFGIEWVKADLLDTDSFELRINLNLGNPGLTVDVTLPATITKTGTAYTLTADGTSYAWTGAAAGLKYGRHVVAGAASWAWAGSVATLQHDKILTADATSWAWTGQSAGLMKGRTMSAEGASWAWAGADASFLRTYALAAGAGSWAWSGADAGLPRGLKLGAGAAAWVWSGDAMTPHYGRNLSAGAFSLSWSGQDAGLAKGRTLTASAAAWAWGGSSIAFGRTYALVASAASWSWSGDTLTLTLTVPSAPPILVERRTWNQMRSEVLRSCGGALYAGWPQRVERLIYEAYLDVCMLFHHRELEASEVFALAQDGYSINYPSGAHILVGVAEVDAEGKSLAFLEHKHLGQWSGGLVSSDPGRPDSYCTLGRRVLLNRKLDMARSYRLLFQRFPVKPDLASGAYPETSEDWDPHILELALAKVGGRCLDVEKLVRNATAFSEFAQSQGSPRILEGTTSLRSSQPTQDRPQQGRRT